jgi:peptide/nickel transport system permease protein
MAVKSPSTVIDLGTETEKRYFTTTVYAVAVAVLAVFALGAGVYQLFHGNAAAAIAAFGVSGVLTTLAWGMWSLQPWRYRYGRYVHLGAVAAAAVIFVVWLVNLISAISASEEIAEAGGSLGVILGEVPSLANLNHLSDVLLLLLINGILFGAMRSFMRTDAERSLDKAYSNEADLLVERFMKNNSARLGGLLVLLLLFVTYLMPRVDPYHGAIVLRDGDLSRRLDPPDCIVGWIRLQQGVDVWEGEGEVPGSILEFPCEHPFGFDKNGRDMLRRVAHGIGVSLAVSLIAVSISLSVGASVGLFSGYLGGWTDSILMRLMDIMLSFPSLLLAIAIVAMRGPGLENGMIAIGVVGVPIYARIARSMAIVAREQEFVTAARSIGASDWRIVRSHVLPNSLAPLIVQSTLGLGTAVIETAALGFLGLGQQPPFPELGKMLAESREVMTSGKWWVLLFPGVTVMVIVLGFNLLGDALRDTLDPKLRGRD